MKPYAKYLTISNNEKEWGIYINVAGNYNSAPRQAYPSPNHPNGYFFNWDNGRVLNEYQINYITDGSGIYETQHGKYSIGAGSVFITFPGVWHRYRPDKNNGWTENYVGFSGVLIDQLIAKSSFSPSNPVIDIGVREEIIDTYMKIFELISNEKPGFQYIVAGMLVKLIGYLISFEKEKDFSGKEIVRVIEEVRFKIRAAVNNEIDFKNMASEYNISYSYLRKMFKKYTGVSPGQYHLHVRIMYAKELIVTTKKSIKEICYETGFQSIHYFSRLFKAKLGIPPSELRKHHTK